MSKISYGQAVYRKTKILEHIFNYDFFKVMTKSFPNKLDMAEV